MFDNFDIVYSDEFTLDELNRIGIVDGEIERLFYGKYRVVYLQSGFVIGYTALKMLVVEFRLDYDRMIISIDEIKLATGYEIEERYCRPRCR